jgi:mitochondrial distribution and morphology protein 12
MSIDLDWSKLDNSLAYSLVSLLNRQLQNTPRPSFIGPVQVTSFDFGTQPPDIELIDLRDIYRDFLEDDDNDDDAENDPTRSTAGQGHHDNPSHEDEDEEEFEWVSRKSAGRGMAEEAPMYHHLPPHIRYGRGPASEMFVAPPPPSTTLLVGPSPSPSPLSAATDLRSRSSSLPGASGAATLPPRSAAPLSHYSYSEQHYPTQSHSRSPSSGGGGAGGALARSLSGTQIFNGASSCSPPPHPFASTTTTTHHHHHTAPPSSSPSPHPNPADIPEDTLPPPGPGRAPPTATAGAAATPPTSANEQPNLQLHLLISWHSDLRLTLTTSLRINYPSPMFMSLPIKLSVTGLVFNGELAVAYQSGRRVHLCVLDELDPYSPSARRTSGSRGSTQSDPDAEGAEEDAKPLPVGQRLLPDIFIESELGQADKHVLKNVTRVEKFIQDVIRKTIEEELVFPNFHTLVLTQ